MVLKVAVMPLQGLGPTRCFEKEVQSVAWSIDWCFEQCCGSLVGHFLTLTVALISCFGIYVVGVGSLSIPIMVLGADVES